MKNNTTPYENKELCTLLRFHTNDDFQKEQPSEARYFKDDNYQSYKKRDNKVPHQVTSVSSSILQGDSEQRHSMTENSPKLVNRVQEPNTNKPDFRWSTDDKLTDQSRNNSAKRHTEMLTRVFHYIVAPPLIKESQRKQHEEEADNDQEFQVDYYEATIQLGRRLLAEILGTILFILVFGSCAIEVGEKRLNREAAAFACGFMALFLAFTLGPISGTHLNPVVTLAFALRFVFPWVWIPFYFLAQFLGSIWATLFLKLLYRKFYIKTGNMD
ncbi:unnamed protein product [Rotaria sordida]|uniref:Aquaporin n=2 Tax=Rotaria sordida TaxID=392033 RepID=A0A814YEG6_9BILA|nr:unnamed protein product [Rotaria sordida]